MFSTTQDASASHLAPICRRPHHRTEVTAQVVRIILVLASRGGAAGQAAVLQHAPAVLNVMLHRQHPDAATDAGNTIVTLLQRPEGLTALSGVQHVDTLLQVVHQRGPALACAARCLAQLANAMPSCRQLLAHPRRQAMLGYVVSGLLASVGQLYDASQQAAAAAAAGVPEQAAAAVPVALDAAGTEAREAFEPVFWVCAAAGACEVVPGYIPQLVALLQRCTWLTVSVYDCLLQLSCFNQGRLALARYLSTVQRCVQARIDERDSSIADAAALAASLRDLAARVQQAVQQLQREQQRTEGRRNHAAKLLADLHGSCRKKQRGSSSSRGVIAPSQGQARELVLWLRGVATLQVQNERLLLQLQMIGAPAL